MICTCRFAFYMLLHLYMSMYASRFGWQDLARLRARHCGEPCKAFTPCYLLDNSNITSVRTGKKRSFLNACCLKSIIVHFFAEWNTFEKYSSQKVVLSYLQQMHFLPYRNIAFAMRFFLL